MMKMMLLRMVKWTIFVKKTDFNSDICSRSSNRKELNRDFRRLVIHLLVRLTF